MWRRIDQLNNSMFNLQQHPDSISVPLQYTYTSYSSPAWNWNTPTFPTGVFVIVFSYLTRGDRDNKVEVWASVPRDGKRRNTS